MSPSDPIRETWTTRTGFVLAAVGSAVGLGNVWRFPFQVGQGGGSAFLVLYLVFVVSIGVPAILIEFTVGRRTKRNPVSALRAFGGERWKYLGYLFVVIGFVILSYYSVVAGWAIRYLLGSVTGGYMDDPTGYFAAVTVGLDALLFHAIFMAAVVGIVAFGVRRGIELAVRVMVPSIILLFIGLAIYAATLPEAGTAYAYYLRPDFGVLAADWRSIVPGAAGQAFFTLSLGMGVMITYASYLGEDRNLAVDSGSIVAIDTGIAFLVGLVVFPILLSAGIEPSAPGAGAVFISLAEAFAGIAFGRLIGAVFFAVLTIAALSSAISLMEVVVAYAIDDRGIDRRPATTAVGIGTFLFGIPVTVDLVFVDLYDIFAAEILLVTGGLLLMILVGWRTPDRAVDELRKGMTRDLGRLGDVWIWLVRVPVILVLLVSLYLAVTGYVEFLREDFAGYLGG